MPPPFLKKLALPLALLFFEKSAAQDLARPTAAQLAWHKRAFYLFVHFGPNTFTDREWGHGDEPETVFNPTNLDTDQWARVAKSAGARGIIITAKHHDGFCLWPSKQSAHTVRESPWRGGRGDVLAELSASCKKHGLGLGFYLSPWDRNHPKYGTPEYNDVYLNSMRELMTGYGPLFEFWWDGACGEEPNGKRQAYDFKTWEKEAARLQPNALIFSDIGPGCRWAGNEQGTLPDSNWCAIDTAGFGRGATGPPAAFLQHGSAFGKNWVPAECDVSIRPGWFFHEKENGQVKSADQLFEIWKQSAGRGANLILNVPPGPDGRIHPRDSVVLKEFGEKKAALFEKNLALGRWQIERLAPLTDGDRATPATRWGTKTPNIYPIDLGKKRRVRAVHLQELVEEGQRIKSFRIEYFHKKQGWLTAAEGSTVGYRKVVFFEKPLWARRLRVVVTDSIGAEQLSEVSVF